MTCRCLLWAFCYTGGKIEEFMWVCRHFSWDKWRGVKRGSTLISLPLPHIHRLSSHAIRSITMIIGFGRLHYCCCLSWASWYPCPHCSSWVACWSTDSYWFTEASIKDRRESSGSWPLQPSAQWAAEFYSWQTDCTKPNLSYRGFLFNGFSAVAPGQAYLFRRRLCLWSFIRAILRRHNFQSSVLPSGFCTHF